MHNRDAARVTKMVVHALDRSGQRGILLTGWKGLLTVPATVVLDSSGTVRHLNLGYASDVRLREQLAGAC